MVVISPYSRIYRSIHLEKKEGLWLKSINNGSSDIVLFYKVLQSEIGSATSHRKRQSLVADNEASVGRLIHSKCEHSLTILIRLVVERCR